MSKATLLADLYKKSVQEYTKNPVEWKGLLSCVARYYKRSFDNAVLVYAQRPDATQLATDSVAYTVFWKCGLSTEMFDEHTFVQ